jgi:Na+(H+)/acetate symporter ActP
MDQKIRALLSAVYAIVLVLAVSLLIGYFWFGGMEAVTGDRLLDRVVMALIVGFVYGIVRFWEIKRKG